jgi:putative PIG3 family NAD(P)H quinone oxidoreductase
MKATLQVDERLVWGEYETPLCQADEVLIRVAATALNRADLVQRTGNYPPPPGASPILGLECSGVIEAIGSNVSSHKVGQEVCALLSGGGYAEYVAVPASQVLPIPSGLSLLEAAAVPEVFATAWLNLKLEGQLQPGERVLMHAGASGVGTAAIQLCKQWGNPICVTVGSADKQQRCLELGAGQALNRHDGPWLEAVRTWGGADVIIDPVGAAYLASNLQALNLKGRLVQIGLMGGREAPLPLGLVLTRRLTIRGSVLRSRSIEEKALVMGRLHHEVWPLLEQKLIQPIVHCVLPIQQADEAHTLLATDSTFGKVILEVSH